MHKSVGIGKLCRQTGGIRDEELLDHSVPPLQYPMRGFVTWNVPIAVSKFPNHHDFARSAVENLPIEKRLLANQQPVRGRECSRRHVAGLNRFPRSRCGKGVTPNTQ